MSAKLTYVNPGSLSSRLQCAFSHVVLAGAAVALFSSDRSAEIRMAT